MRFLPTSAHAVLDYLGAAALFFLPRLNNWNATATTIFTVAALLVLGQSLLTRYELGAFKAIPTKGHLALDFLLGVGLVGLAIILTDQPDTVRRMLTAFGLFEIVAALITKTRSSYEIAHDGVPATVTR